MKVVFTYSRKGQPPDYGPLAPSNKAEKLADAALHFEEGPLQGQVLVGFTVWRFMDGSLGVNEPWRQIVGGPMAGARYSILRDAKAEGLKLRHPLTDRCERFILDAWERENHQGLAKRFVDAWKADGVTETTIPIYRALKEWPRLKAELERVERALPPEYVEFMNRSKMT